VFVAIGIPVGLLFLGLLYEQVSRVRDRNLSLPGRLVDMGGYRLHLTDEGTGGPPVAVVHGVGDCSYSWIHVRKEIARFTRVLSFDRAGLGASPAGPTPDPVRTVEELGNVLAKSGAPGPYVLVGHSLGGIIVRLYALKYPDQVAGMVLVDSTHETLLEDPKFLLSLKVVVLLAKVMRALSIFGLPRFLGELGLMPMYAQERQYYARQLSPFEYRQWLAAYNRNIASRASVPEGLSAFPMIAEARQLMSPTQFGDLPVAVLNNPGFGPGWTEKQTELASRSTNSTHQVSDRPGHSLQMPRPELVVEAVRHVVAQVRERSARVS
jgi:pimeloyl-ACP methyl ester carboxylesterase